MLIEKNIESSKQAIKILDEIDGTNLLNEYFEGNKIIKRFPDSIKKRFIIRHTKTKSYIFFPFDPRIEFNIDNKYQEIKYLEFNIDEKTNPLNIELLYFDGPIGCGKSSLKSDKIFKIDEPIELWYLDTKDNLVTKYTEYCYEFCLKYDYIQNLIINIYSNYKKYKKFGIERSIFDHELFSAWNGKEQFNKKYLLELFNFIHKDLLFNVIIDKIKIINPYKIFLNSTIKEYEGYIKKNYENIKKRNREFEIKFLETFNYNIFCFNRFYHEKYNKAYIKCVNYIIFNSNIDISMVDYIYYLNSMSQCLNSSIIL